MRRLLVVLFTSVLLVGAAACGDDGGGGSGGTAPEGGDTHPAITEVTPILQDDGAWRIRVAMTSNYDSAERFADAWRILAPDGTELGLREFEGPHGNEQPFVRALEDVEIPEDIVTITVEGRDSVNGWGGTTLDADLVRE